MKLSISNLVWDSKHDDAMYKFIRDHKIGLEVSPARIFQWEENKYNGRMVSPYERSTEASYWYNLIHNHYNIDVAAMKSVLYKVDNNLFLNKVYRRYLTEYLRDAVNFASMINCPTMVFGCAANRNIPNNMNRKEAEAIAVDFFSNLAEYALEKGVCIALEPISKEFGCNFINTSEEAFEFIRRVDKESFKVNVDLGMIISNNEDVSSVFTDDNIKLINHVHISEPGLVPFQKRDIHKETARLLKEKDYDKYVSVEMNTFPDIRLVQGLLNYFNNLFIEE